MKNILKYGMILCTCLLISPSCLAETVIKENVKYNLNDRKMTAVYEEYVGNESPNEAEYIFPRDVSVNGKTYIVNEIASNAVKKLKAKRLVFSDAVNKILVSDLYRFELEVNSNNQSFLVKDNVLYSIDKKTLLKSGKQDGTINVIDGVETVKEKAFAESGVQKIIFPASLKNIEKEMFLNCKNLKKIQIASSNSYMTVVDGAIYSKNKRKLLSAGVAKGTFILPQKTIEIQRCAFAGNQTVKKVVINGRMKKLGKEGFAYSEIRNIELPETLCIVGKGAFRECKNLKKVVFPESIKKIDKDVFIGCRKLEKVKLPSNIKVIDKNTFMNCPSLRKIVLPDKIQIIKSGAFKNCGFTKLIIPKSVKKIEKNALETTIGILKFKGKKVPQIANQEVCLFGENEAGQQVPEYLDEMFNYDIIRGIGVVVVPKGKCSEYRNKLDKKMRYQTIKESAFVVHS